ncbi:hypothetical protein ACEWY4_007016 [Coilia grayii]|uniref:DDE-1 domain-containing protein n=1 Tax=Coilia grayii TaxID=363190 RepID=A0ABD1KFB3_9TELE
MKRNPHISLRKPEALSAARASGMNHVVVDSWFQTYRALLNDLGIQDVPCHLWNTDESGLQDHFISKKVVGATGKACFQVTAGEKGETVTIVAGFNAVGTFTPTMVIFKGKRINPDWVDNMPENTIVRVSDNGWITSQLFLDWGHRFVQQLPKDDRRPHVLLLDGHYSHVFNIQFLHLMKKHNVHVLCYPPHTTHALQPADKALFRSLKHHWQEAGRRWIRQTGGKRLPKQLFFSIFTPAWRKAATVENAQAGFRASGMFPVQQEVIPNELFLPSQRTEREENVVFSEADIAVALEEEVFTTSTFLPDTPNTDAAFIPRPPNTDTAFIPGPPNTDAAFIPRPLTTSRPTPSNHLQAHTIHLHRQAHTIHLQVCRHHQPSYKAAREEEDGGEATLLSPDQP